jgi:hypothetical protein
MTKEKKIEANGRTPVATEGTKPKTPIDWKQVEKLCYLHCSVSEIYNFLEIDEKTLWNACRENWDMSPGEKFKEWYDKGKVSLRRKQWTLADSNPTMAIFLGKQYLGQRDKKEEESDSVQNVIRALASFIKNPDAISGTEEPK